MHRAIYQTRYVAGRSFIFKWPRSDMSSRTYELLTRGMRATAGIYVATINSTDVLK